MARGFTGGSLEMQDKGECQSKQESLSTQAPGHPDVTLSSHIMLGRCPQRPGLVRKFYFPSLGSPASTASRVGLVSSSSLHLLSSHFLICPHRVGESER